MSNGFGTERKYYSEYDIGYNQFSRGEFEPYFQDTNVTPDYINAKGRYYTVGELVYIEFRVEFTNVTNFGTGQYFIILPFESATDCSIVGGTIHDVSLGHQYTLKGDLDKDSKIMKLFSVGGGSRDLAFAHNHPINIATDDYIHFQGWYRRVTTV